MKFLTFAFVINFLLVCCPNVDIFYNLILIYIYFIIYKYSHAWVI